MKTFACKINYQVLWLVCAGFLLVKAAFGQTAVGSQSATLQTFKQQQQVLAQSFNALMAQGATPQQMAAWQTQNAAALQAQQQRAQALAASSAQPMPLIQQVVIPADATPEMEEFLTNRATLANNFALQQNQNPTATGAALLQQQNATLLQRQAQLARILATQSQTTIPLPPPVQIPANATSQTAAYLTLRNQLMREQLQVQNQYAAAAPAVAEAALQQWRQTNASRFQQLQQLTQNTRPSTATAPGTSTP